MVDALGRRNVGDSTLLTTNEGTSTVTNVNPSTPPQSGDVITTAPRGHRVDLPSTQPGSLVDFIRESPTTRAVILGAGGLSSLFVGASTANAEVRHVAPVNTQQQGPKTIVFVGMNEGAHHEVENLRNRVGAAGVTFVKPSAVQGQVTHNNKTYDLNTAEGRLGFATAIGLKTDKAQALASILEDVDADARDEAAQLARVFRDAERGQKTIERVVLSGHSVGSGIWGDGNGYLKLDSIGKLALLFPQAAGQVQDLMMAACYSGGESAMDKYTAIFPNLRSVWAYDGSAPGSYSGAVPHILRWEKGSRNNDGDTMSRTVANHTRKGENVAVWTIEKGYDNGKALGPIEGDRATYASTGLVLDAFRSGEQAVDNPQTGPLRTHYNSIQRLLSRGDLPAAERETLETERDFVIRLLYFKNVGNFFQATYAQDIASTFNEAGLSVPNFSTLSRKDALARISELEAKIEATPSMSSKSKAFAERLHKTFVDLLPSHVPAAWI